MVKDIKKLTMQEIVDKLLDAGYAVAPNCISYADEGFCILLQNIIINDYDNKYYFPDCIISIYRYHENNDFNIIHYDDNYLHPHMDAGDICLGPADNLRNIIFYDPVTAIKQLHSVLCNYNEDSCYINIDQFRSLIDNNRDKNSNSNNIINTNTNTNKPINCEVCSLITTNKRFCDNCTNIYPELKLESDKIYQFEYCVKCEKKVKNVYGGKKGKVINNQFFCGRHK